MLTGFTTILAVIGVGAVLGHVGVLDVRGQRSLAEVSFFAATPALMFVTISEVALDREVAANVAASAAALAVPALAYALLVGVLWRRDRGEVLVGALASCYVNAGNLGLAVAAYVVGDAAVVVPTLLVQLLVVQPLSLAYLDRRAGGPVGAVGAVGAGRVLRRVTTNPLTVASAAGLVVAVTDARPPDAVDAPVRLLAGLAIPAMLLAYGAALRSSPPVGRAGHRREVATATTLKVVVMPLVAWGVGTAAGLEGSALLGVVTTAALPTAQNIFLHATRYRTAETVVREVVLLTTVASLPAVLLVQLLLG